MNANVRLVAWSLVVVLTMVVSASCGSDREVHVKGYTRKDGTVVKGYTRQAPGSTDTVKVKSYTRKDGTVVSGHERTKPKTADKSTGK